MVLPYPIRGLATLPAMISAVRIKNVAHFSASDLELVAITLTAIEHKKLGFVLSQIVC